MTRDIFKYLKSYSTDPQTIDRLLTSAFVLENQVDIGKNQLLSQYFIKKADHDYEALLHFLDFFKKKERIRLDIESLIRLFEFVISPADKEFNGAVYTPKPIREYMVEQVIYRLEASQKKLDILSYGDLSCGCGGFFITLAKQLKSKTGISYRVLFAENFFGVDLTAYSVRRAEILLSLFAIIEGEESEDFDFNLHQGDALDLKWPSSISVKLEGSNLDVVIGNPPYVCARNMEASTRQHLSKWKVSKVGNPDLYIIFFEIGLKYLKPSGILAYITLNTFIHSLNGKLLRELLSREKYKIELIDFKGEQLFQGRTTYTCISFIQKTESRHVYYVKTNSSNFSKINGQGYASIPYEKLQSADFWTLNDSSTSKMVDKIKNTGSSLGSVFEIRNGFATLRNRVYLFTPLEEDEEFYFFEKDKAIYKIEKDICKDAVKPNLLKKEGDLERIKEKLIFPYFEQSKPNLFSEHVKVILMDENTLKNQYPNAYQYLESQKTELSKRDKGKREYENWFAYGRRQALGLRGKNLLFPHISDRPVFTFSDQTDLFFYDGFAIFHHSSRELRVLKRILESDFFWFYIKNTSKPYNTKYYSLSKTYIQNFGVCDLSEAEKDMLLSERFADRNVLNKFLSEKYELELSLTSSP